MDSGERIARLRQQVQRWLQVTPAGDDVAGAGTLEGLDADLAAFEGELRTLFSSEGVSPTPFEALREQAVLRTVLESMVEGVIVADMEGHLLIFNASARELLGQGPLDHGPSAWSEAYGLFYADGKTLCPSEELPLSRALRGESVDGAELVVRSPERGLERHIRANGRPLWDSDGRQIGAVVVFHDTSRAKALEREMQRARESAEETARIKSEFLANMSHEIRTPLTAVLGFTDLLLDATLSESDRLNYIQAVRRNGEHLLALINDVLDLSKIHANQIKVESVECSLHQVLHEAASVMQVRAYEKGLDFAITYDTPIPAHIRSDPMRIRQIMLNLLSNAIKFTRQGRVRLTARCLAVGTSASRVEIAVTDTGIGLNTTEIDGLFLPFQQANATTTRQYGGTGLGLAISRSLAEALGGDIQVCSTPGQGSTFTFTLHQPIDEDMAMVQASGTMAVETEAETGRPETGQALTGRVLLVEDGLDNQLLLSTLLRRQGLEVEIADNGQAAVTQALAALEEDRPFDVILMDMQLPKLDGYGATAKLRAKGYSGAIIALTAHVMSGERERCLTAGCDDYLSKPIGRQALLEAVEPYLTPRRTGRLVLTPSEPVGVGEKQQASITPLYSHYADDPDMDELIAGFVERLAGQLHDIRVAAGNGELAHLKHLAHQLKGAAGGYGFMPVSRAAEALESVAQDASRTDDVSEAVNRLSAVCDRVRPGQQRAEDDA
ncbi:ATP-binding protein [Halomonas cerina]|uniref:histidine kinase n=1 Tax=Halomonas cerina TaxID=447424 RepID=A0A839VD65_9GAMM|nr:ATP-binding protein [Halomonas cerina]MBB3190614.1 signal transduction histidine kinase/ActR/RegA family two-component response regulator/HPt (histidine-containing phosphotransfer) domain-containing protein [Halomonas cerina]